MSKKKPNFSGCASKYNVPCEDGVTIASGAFKNQDGVKVPVVWQHLHNDPDYVLGHAIMHERSDGIYADVYLNETPKAIQTKNLIEHGDLDALSIFANGITKRSNTVTQGLIREVSVVLSGANPKAVIDPVSIAHSDGTFETSDEEAIIRMGSDCHIIMHSSEKEEDDDNEEDSKTIEEVIDSLDDDQVALIGAMVEALKSGAIKMSDIEEEGEEVLKQNPFAKNDTIQHSAGGEIVGSNICVLTKEQEQEIMRDAVKMGSFRESVIAHAATYGIDNIDVLFPDARNITNEPTLVKRRTEWVSSVIDGARHSPFSRIKSTTIDITADEARALGYIKGNQKKEEVIKAAKRITGPTTIYKKQKLDRDDVVDITDFNVVNYIRREMRIMLDEELARAILVGDGRDISSNDKINEECIRPIVSDDDLYVIHQGVFVSNYDAGFDDSETTNFIRAVVMCMADYEGSGNTIAFMDTKLVASLRLAQDNEGRYMFRSLEEVVSMMGVGRIVGVPLLSTRQYTRKNNSGTDVKFRTVAIILDMNDYTIGADNGGTIFNHDAFDIDYNQYKYLMETRVSGALYRPKSAIVIGSTSQASAANELRSTAK